MKKAKKLVISNILGIISATLSAISVFIPWVLVTSENPFISDISYNLLDVGTGKGEADGKTLLLVMALTILVTAVFMTVFNVILLIKYNGNLVLTKILLPVVIISCSMFVFLSTAMKAEYAVVSVIKNMDSDVMNVRPNFGMITLIIADIMGIASEIFTFLRK